ncbi:hypothetical protein H7849_11770 [Alloacidobacterium dinghuense]|uniref:Uncharacterized protein n=1 Tax=Alloacidobacterium dinghuense TaxID=2763107 RepID=A0A7G8BPN3_9BACT|nr:hypothetical protein [Alloacidobacterium dinghuense]QNI34503.1 hypothetical protein H7849_11770 [Alloacidobacterium dinghuense]
MTAKIERLLAEADNHILDIRVCANAARRMDGETAKAFVKMGEAAKRELAHTLRLALDEATGRKAAR